MSDELQGTVKTFLADPPWRYKSGPGRRGAADKHYITMSLKEIEEYGGLVKFLRDPNGAHLYLWTPHSFLFEARDVMEEWGFKYVTKIVWVKGELKAETFNDEDGQLYVRPFVKLRKGMGGLFRGAHEDLLVGRTKRLPKNKGVGAIPDVIIAPATKHSAKPPEAIGVIEQMSPSPYYEMFARNLAPGWEGFGLELENSRGDE